MCVFQPVPDIPKVPVIPNAPPPTPTALSVERPEALKGSKERIPDLIGTGFGLESLMIPLIMPLGPV